MYAMEKIVPSYVEEYLRELIPEKSGFLSALEAEAADTETYAPIIEPEVAALLTVLIKIHRPKRILELGTAIGYSAIVMAKAMGDGEIVTVERYDKMYERAIENIRRAKLSHIIKPVLDEAENALTWLDGGFDMIFLDSAKGQYLEFLPGCMRLLKVGGLLVSDDVLYKGEVTCEVDTERRKITIVKRLREYLKYISDCEFLTTSVIPIGNGVAISYKEKEYEKN